MSEKEPKPVDSTNQIVDLDDVKDEVVVAGDSFDELVRHLAEIQAQYPLKLSKEECLAMRANNQGFWKDYLHDSLQDDKHETIGGPNVKDFDIKAKTAIVDGHPCPICGDKRELEYLCRGKETNFYFLKTIPCWCVDYINYETLVATMLPETLRRFSLATLKPNLKSKLALSRQENEIAFLRQHSDDSYFFLGKPGTSKTTFAAALYRRAIGRSFARFKQPYFYIPCLWRVDGNHLFESEVAYATANDKETVRRDVTVDEIIRAKKNGYRPVILLEEIDKRKPTEFTVNTLFRLINTLDESNGQLVLTTNQTMAGFRDVFLKSGIEQVRITGEALLRRLTDPDRIHIRDYFKEEKS